MTHTVADGTVVTASAQVDAEVTPVVTAIQAHLVRTPEPVHLDETGLRAAHKLYGVHVASTAHLTYLLAHLRRGSQADAELGILPKRTGWVIHDDYHCYWQATAARHATCNADHLRELLFLEERYQETWATDLAHLLCEIKQAVSGAVQAGQVALTGAQVRRLHSATKNASTAATRPTPCRSTTGGAQEARPPQAVASLQSAGSLAAAPSGCLGFHVRFQSAV